MSIEIKKEILDLATKLKSEFTLDHKTGIVAVTADAYEKLLPEGLTKEIVEQLQTYNTEMLAASTYMVGEMSIPAMTKNKDLDNVKLEMPMIGKDLLHVSFDRSRQVPSRGEDGVAGTKTKFGASSASFEIYSAGPRGELKKIKHMLAEQAAAAFGK